MHKFFGRFFQKRTASFSPGFTLLEILVAVVVLGFIVAGLSQGTRFGINAWDVQDPACRTMRHEIERLDRVLRLLVENAAPPMSADEKPMDGQEHRLDPGHAPAGPAADPADPARPGGDSAWTTSTACSLRWVAHPNAFAHHPRAPPPQEIVLAEGVDHLDVSYRQALADGGRWKTNWDDSNLPALVTMHIVLVSTHRQIPLIEAATMVDTNGSF